MALANFSFRRFWSCSLAAAQISIELHAGADWSVLNPGSTWPRRARSLLYGRNDMSAGKPNMFSLAAEQLMHPMFLVQVSKDVSSLADCLKAEHQSVSWELCVPCGFQHCGCLYQT